MTLKLNDMSCIPHHKPDNNLFFLRKELNHPLNILRQIPLSIEKEIIYSIIKWRRI